ncbi:MAG TPA: helix-turn-helix transcriptional regulator [Thermoanaerobaculia bacterium]|nr:helix-turn-helix transcriptional regulator [Thermoanaerobaculia bacterium]
MEGEAMNRDCIKIRLFRAASGKTQEKLAQDMGSDASSLAQWELGLHVPATEQVKRAAEAAGLTLEWADEVLDVIERHGRKRLRPGQGADDIFAEVGKTADTSASQVVQRLLSLPPRPAPPRHEDRLQARAQLPRLAKLTPAERAAVVRLGRDYQAWALCIEAGEASAEAVSKSTQEGTLLAEMAEELASLIEGLPGWPEAVKSHAVAYRANVLRASGKVKDARVLFEEAKRLAKAGSDPYGVLDPGRLLEFEASLCRAERRLKPALKLLDAAAAIGHCPARALINKGATLAVMGEYEEAIKTLRNAKPQVEREGDTRLAYMWRFNLSVNLTHLSEFEEAEQHLQEVRRLATERGDEIELIRVTWLEGRLLLGLGRRAAARFYLEQAAGQFEAKELWYDVALARQELAGLLLEEGRTAEVKALTPALAAAFEAEGVYLEALKALRLFQEAVDREQATAELARRVLRFLFRARHDPALRYAS